MTSPLALAHEKIWFEKCKYDEAETQYFESLAKLLVNNGITCHPSPDPPASVVCNKQPKIQQETPGIPSPVKKQRPANSAQIVVKKETSPPKEISPPTIQVPQPQNKDEKRFKPKEAKEKRNKADKKGRDRRILKDDSKGSPNTPLKNSLAGEVAKARQHIKNSLECMDGIAALATNVNVELVNRLNSIEKENVSLKKLVSDLQSIVKQLETRVKTLESDCVKSSPSIPSGAPTPAPTPVKKDPNEDVDDGVDLFASDSEEESDAAKMVKEERLAAYAAKKAKKPVLIAKSNIILDVKPWDDETDMKAMEVAVRTVKTDGLLWGASKLVPLAYGIHKLQISSVVEDDKVSVDWLQEKLEEIEDYVQSVDIAAFNKV